MTKLNILLAEDDPRLGALVVRLLNKTGLAEVDWVRNGDDAYDYCLGAYYDVALFDWMMPGSSGADVCRKLRSEGYSGAILMLTAKDSLQDRVQGLDAGADDYLVKPFELEELLARIRALTRRNFAPIIEEQAQLGAAEGLLLNRGMHTVEDGRLSVQLSPREYQLLDLLHRNRGAVLPRELILERVWGFDSDVSLKTVDATVKLLRKRLEPFEEGLQIASIRGVGYKLE